MFVVMLHNMKTWPNGLCNTKKSTNGHYRFPHNIGKGPGSETRVGPKGSKMMRLMWNAEEGEGKGA